MKSLLIAALLGAALMVASCQTPPPERRSHDKSQFDYTLLGFWRENYIVWEISRDLEAAGIRNQVTRGPLSAINVESSKLRQARAIVTRQSEWVEKQIVPRSTLQVE